VKKTGRPKGVTARDSKEVKALIEAHLGEPLVVYMMKIMDKVRSPQERLEHLHKLMPYVHPKLANIEHSGGIDVNQTEKVEKLAKVLSVVKSA
jgi:hypothetical protein